MVEGSDGRKVGRKDGSDGKKKGSDGRKETEGTERKRNEGTQAGR